MGRKYGEHLYKHFKVMEDVDSYDFLINLFGKNNLEKALDNQEATTAQIADKLFKAKDIENLNEMQSNYVLKNIRNCIAFNRATGLNLSEFQIGIKPETFSRESLNNKNMLEIFEENRVTKDILKEIYDIYSEEIIFCYNNDSYLRNKTVLKLDGKHEKITAVGGLQDHVTYYSDEDFKIIFNKYFNNEDLSASYDELISEEKRFGDNTEVVLFRNSYEASLKPSYVMYIGNDKLDSMAEKRNIESIKNQMKEAGLDVPLVIFDRYTIREKIKNNEIEQNNEVEER